MSARVSCVQYVGRGLKNFISKFINNFILVFARETTIHGVPLTVIPKLHFGERLFWLAVLTLSLLGAASLTLSNWNRFSANPTVVSIQKDYRNWKNTLPSATGCLIHKTDPDFVDKYIADTWGISNASDPKYDYYAGYINAVANISYQSLDAFIPFKDDPEFNKINMLELAAKVHPEVTGTLVTFDPRLNTYWKLIMTEMGMCFVVNNKFSNVMTFNVKGINVTKPNIDESILKCHYLNGLCYARYDADPRSTLNFYVHSYLDVLHATMSPYYYLRESEEFEINYLIQETTAAPALRQLSPSQRKCRFDNEPLTPDAPIYSTSMCYISCRYKLAMRLCGCRPYFYHFMSGKICNVTGLLCLAQHAEYITGAPSEIGCKCPQPCEMITYLPLIPRITIWTTGYFDQRITFRWGIMHPTTKYKREVLFGFDDLVVSIGGTLALFLGVSFISLIEVIFFAVEFLGSLFHSEDPYANEHKPSTAIKLYDKNARNVKGHKNSHDFIVLNQNDAVTQFQKQKAFRIQLKPCYNANNRQYH